MKQEKTEQKRGEWRKILLSPTLAGKSAGKRVAYIAVVTALVVVCNMFFEFKLAETQFSFTIVVSALAGILIGPLFGFVSCFLGDLVGFLYHSAGFAYLPWIGISMGITALLSGLIIGGFEGKKGWFLYVKLAIVTLLTFAICTVAINTTAFWILYSKVDYWTYFVSRIFVQGQIWNTLFNAALLFIVVPTLKSIKPLKIYIN
jgi:ECF transporter S component (folate family)